MPMFEYRCEGCGHVAEFLEKADADARHTCEECGAEGMKKIFSAFSARMAPTRQVAPRCESCSRSRACPMVQS